MIPMVDLQKQYKLLKPEIDAAIQGVLDKSQFIMGANVDLLEREIAAYHNVIFGIGVASGTDALLLALRGCGIGKGDEVITTPFTFIATAEAILHLNAIPVFVDIDEKTFNIDVSKIEAKITERTKAILPVHLFGHPVEMGRIIELGNKYNLKIIEDCAQSFGAEYKGRKTGSFGHCGCFSFFPSKNLACYGDGGMIITDDEDIALTIKMLRNHGSSVKYYHKALGYNSRLDEIQAAIVRVKLREINKFNELRRMNASLYRENIKRDDIIVPFEKEGSYHVYHQFTMRSRRRDSIMECLKKHDISSAIYYPVPLHKQDVFAALDLDKSDLKNSETSAEEVFSLPMYPELSAQEIFYICDVINAS